LIAFILPWVPTGFPLNGRWLNTQRTNYKKNSLSQERIEKLESIGFEWKLRKSWEDMFKSLVEFKNKNGHCNVQWDYKDDPQLGIWVRNQRVNYENNILSQKRIEKLESVGFEW
jgi:hypothetical protein